jgi:hypothetical protein
VFQPLGGTIDSAYWFIDNILDSTLNENEIYNQIFNNGEYTIGLEVETEFGCKSSTSYDTINVVDIPIADIEISDTIICVGDTFEISNFSTGYITNYEWNIYDENNNLYFTFSNDTSTVPEFPILEQGQYDIQYTISLTTSNCCGSTTSNIFLTVKPIPIVGFAMNTNEICSQDNIEFQFDSLIYGNTDSLLIYFGDGDSLYLYPDNTPPTVWDNISHQYIGDTITYSDTTYYIEIIGFNDCGQSNFIDSVLVKPLDIQSFFTTTSWYDPDTCEVLNVDFIEQSLAPAESNVTWCFDWDNNINSCNDNIYSPDEFIFGDTISYSYQEAGEFIVMHSINDFVCNFDTSYFSFIVVFPLPEADFEFSNACLNDTIVFQNTSTIDSDIISPPTNISGYRWYVNGELVSDTDINLSYKFTDPGSQDISLVAISDRNCLDSTTYQVFIYENPTANFVADSVCFNSIETSFNGSISTLGDPNSSINNWTWNFGDLNSPFNELFSSNSNPTHLYTSPGVFEVSLIIEDNLGCSDTTENFIRVWNNPIANFFSDTVCFGDETNFIGFSSIGDANITSWSWNYGDFSVNVIEFDSISSHTYPSTGYFYPSLTVTDDYGCIDSFSDSIRVWSIPEMNFTSSTNCFGENTTFINNEIITDGNSIVTTIWDFGDTNNILSNSSTELESQHIYSDCGIFYPIINYTDNLGCQGSTQIQAQVICNPIAEFTTFESVCFGEITEFINLSTPINTDSSLFINQYEWSIPSGEYVGIDNQNSTNPSFLFSECNSAFNVQLNVELNQYGCADSVIREVAVYCNPEANFEYGNACSGEQIQFNDLSIFGDTSIQSWIWSNQVDGIVSINSNPLVTLGTFGYVPITLQVTDYYGCIDDTTITIEIFNLPTPNFEVDDICVINDSNQPNQIVLVDNSSVGLPPSNPLELWSFDFGDGLPSLLLNDINSGDSITYMYTNINEYVGDTNIITLTLIDTLGCKNVIFDTIFLHPSPLVEFSIESLCEDELPLILDDNTQWSNNIDPIFLELGSYIQTIGQLNGPPDGNVLQTVFIGDNSQPIPSSLDVYNFNSPLSQGVDTLIYSVSFESNFGCKGTSFLTTQIFDTPEIEITSINYLGSKCGSNVEVQLNSDVSDLLDISNSNLNYPNYYWDLSFLEDLIYEKNPIVYIPQPSNDTIVTLWGSNYFVHENSIKECSSSTDTTLFSFPEINAGLNVNPKDGCEPQTFILEGYYEEVGNTGVNFEIENWSYEILPQNGNSATFIPGFGLPIETQSSDNLYTIGDNVTDYFIEFYIKSEGGCKDSVLENVQVYPTPIPFFTYDKKLSPEGVYYGAYTFSGSALTLSSTSLYEPDYDFLWFIDGEPLPNNQTTGQMTLEYTFPSIQDYNGTLYEICLMVSSPFGSSQCDSIYCDTVRVDFAKGLYVPNALSPDLNDGLAREFLPAGKSLKEYKLQIFDTWGNIIWETESLDENGSPNKGWKGLNKNGLPVPQGVYVWKIIAVFSDNEAWIGNNKAGSVTLIR